MNLRETLQLDLKKAVGDTGSNVEVYPGKDTKLAHFFSPVAFNLSKQTKEKPHLIAKQIIEKYTDSACILDKVEAVNGFINFKLKRECITECIERIIQEGDCWGKNNIGGGRRVLLESISANPTGPLHVGHGRAAAITDVLRRILCFCGFKVYSEYYINDCGSQIELLCKSTQAMISKLRGNSQVSIADGYKGQYIEDLAREYIESCAGNDLKEFLIDRLMTMIKATLKRFGVQIDSFCRESEIASSKSRRNLLETLDRLGYIYKDNNAIYFKAKQFSDIQDRVLVRANGESTYFFNDILYHQHKYQRNFDILINIWGADHIGYVERLKSALAALNLPVDSLKIVLYQLVRLVRGGEVVSMSTRAGEYVTLDTLMDEVGEESTKFHLLTRRLNSILEFNIDAVKQYDMDNPMYYIQYAHARCCGIINRAKNISNLPKRANLSLLDSDSETTLMLKMALFPDELASVVNTSEPYRLVLYLQELASYFHNYYNHQRVISEDKPKSIARLKLISALRITLNNALTLLGVKAPQQM